MDAVPFSVVKLNVSRPGTSEVKSKDPSVTPPASLTFLTIVISPTLGVSAVNVQSAQVYPNPAIDLLNITKVSDKATYKIVSMTGQVVAQGKVINNKVQVSQLVKGAYIIAIDNNGEVSQVKFIKK